MKAFKYLLFIPALALLYSCEKLDETLEDVGLTEEEIVQGLKEALKVGTNNSVDSTARVDGYYGNARIKIPFPSEAQNVVNVVSTLPGGTALVDQVTLKLNRAAEEAADKAAPIFIDAIVNMTVTDAVNILHGEDSAATAYLRTNTSTQLHTAFKPDIQDALTSVGAQQAWSELTNLYNTVPFVDPVNTDLADYTTDRALRGLFILVIDEEAKIRNDVSARVNDLLKKVFAEQD